MRMGLWVGLALEGIFQIYLKNDPHRCPGRRPLYDAENITRIRRLGYKNRSLVYIEAPGLSGEPLPEVSHLSLDCLLLVRLGKTTLHPPVNGTWRNQTRTAPHRGL